jgi:hypothetical protein
MKTLSKNAHETAARAAGWYYRNGEWIHDQRPHVGYETAEQLCAHEEIEVEV